MLISIIIPCYNSEETIKDCLNSIKEQSYKNFEIKIIDNLSTDKTLSIIDEFDFSHIEIISQRDSGIYDAINKGISLSNGEIISVLHSDDLFYDRNVLSEIANCFFKKDVNIIYGNLIYVKRRELNKIIRFWRPGKFIRGSFLKGWSPPHPSFFVKKKTFLQFGKYNTTIGNPADIELMHRYLEIFNIKSIYIDKIFVKMRYGGQSNKSLKNILVQNYSILKFLKINKNIFKVLKFIFHKLTDRINQIIKRK